MKTDTKRHYIDNKAFLAEIIKYHRTGEITEELWMFFYKIAQNYSSLGKFRNYTYLDDMRSEAVLRCIRYVKSFDHVNKSNPFSYFTTVIHNSFIQFLNKEKVQEEKKWRELRNIYETYMADTDISMGIPENVMKRMYGDNE